MNAFFKFAEVNKQDCPLAKLSKSFSPEKESVAQLDKPLAKDVDNGKEIKQPTSDIPAEEPKKPSAGPETTRKNEVKEDDDGKKRYYDDNGNLYRVDDELLPNCEYEINGYKYQTDDMGRIVTAEGNLRYKDRAGRLPIKDTMEKIGKGDQKEGDERGHLIGDQFDGSSGLENMIPQDADINGKDFRNFENELAKEVKDGKTVYYKVEPIYDGDSRRPSAIVVTYSIEGVESVRVFPNGKES